jgi:hypothetical protein
MKLELIREKDRLFPSIENPLDYTQIRIWHCRYQSLSPLSRFRNLEKIEIATYPDPSLEFVSGLTKVKSLFIIHLPKVSDIAPFSHLEALETLELAILPSWNKLQHISTLTPLRGLKRLRALTLHGILVNDGSLRPLHSCPTLEEFQSGNLFSMQQLLNLKAVKPNIKGMFFEPVVELPFDPCSKCGSPRVILSGITSHSIHCPKCHRNRVQRHLSEWQVYTTAIAA